MKLLLLFILLGYTGSSDSSDQQQNDCTIVFGRSDYGNSLLLFTDGSVVLDGTCSIYRSIPPDRCKTECDSIPCYSEWISGGGDWIQS